MFPRPPLRPDSRLLLDVLLEIVAGEGEHPALGVVDQNDLPCLQQPLADRQGADRVVGDRSPGVTDDMRLAVLEAEDAVDVQPRVLQATTASLRDGDSGRGPANFSA